MRQSCIPHTHTYPLCWSFITKFDYFPLRVCNLRGFTATHKEGGRERGREEERGKLFELLYKGRLGKLTCIRNIVALDIEVGKN